MGKLGRMDFRTFFLGMTPADRAAYAQRAQTSVGYLNQIAYGHKRVDLGFADVLVALAPPGALSLDELPLTERAAEQRVLRAWPANVAAAEPAAQAPAPAVSA